MDAPRENEETYPTKSELFEMLTRFEECICDAITLNAALMVLMDNKNFKELNYELLLQISYRLKEANGQIKNGYGVMKRVG